MHTGSRGPSGRAATSRHTLCFAQEDKEQKVRHNTYRCRYQKKRCCGAFSPSKFVGEPQRWATMWGATWRTRFRRGNQSAYAHTRASHPRSDANARRRLSMVEVSTGQVAGPQRMHSMTGT
jgi:hypothetical protein